jgi:hypothetical protein
LVEQRIRNAKVGSSTLFTGTIQSDLGATRAECRMSAYNRDQWIESFEGQLAILRPHLTQRVLSTWGLAAWHAHGTSGADPIEVARAVSVELSESGAATCW